MGKKYAYMCKTGWEWELGEALGGIDLYPSVEDLLENRKCAETCGIVKVKIQLSEVVQEPKRVKRAIKNRKKLDEKK